MTRSQRIFKAPLTFEEHEALGAELQEMRDRLGEIIARISGRYRCPELDAALKAQRAVDRLRSLMDDRFGEDCPEHDCGMASKIYYRGARG